MKKALLVLFATGWFLGCFAQEIQFETVEHDFGLVNYNDPAVFDFVFTNTGTEPLLVQKPKSSCGCTIPSWPKDPIMPGQKDKVSVTYRTNRAGAINRTVTVTSNAKNSPQIVLRIKGRVLEVGGIKPSQKNGKWGLADGNGNVIIQFEYDEIKFAKNGNFNIRKKEKWGIADKDGVVIPCEYDNEIDLSETMSVKKGGKWGIIDNKNKVLIPFEYDLAFVFADNMPVRKGGKWGIVDNKNKVLIPYEYDDRFNLSETMSVKKGGKWGIIDNKNKVLIPFEYDLEFNYSNNMPVKKGGKWGVIDKKNNIIIPFEYDGIEGCDYNSAKVQKNGKWGFVTKGNKVVIPFGYYEDLEFDGNNGVICAKKNGKWGLIDKNNKAITGFFAEKMFCRGDMFKTLVFFQCPAKFEGENMPKELANKWGAITTNGNCIIPPIIDNVVLVMAFASEKGYDKTDCNQLDSEKERESNLGGLFLMNDALNKMLKE